MRFTVEEINKAIYRATIGALEGMLERESIPFVQGRLWDGFKITFPWCDGDVVCHSGSYGSKWGHVESMGFPWDDEDVTEDDVGSMAQRIIDYYNYAVKGVIEEEE